MNFLLRVKRKDVFCRKILDQEFMATYLEILEISLLIELSEQESKKKIRVTRFILE